MEAEADGTTVMDALYANKSSLEAIFNIIDADNSGSFSIKNIRFIQWWLLYAPYIGEITLDEFEKAIDLLVAHMPGVYSKAEMLEKCRMMDLNGDGKVDLNEFLEAFRLSDVHRKQQHEADIRKRSTTRACINQPTSESVTKLANIISKNTLVVEQDIDPNDCEARVINPK